MERCMRKCKGLEEVAVMEKTAETVAAAERKRKISFGESELSTFSIQLKTRRLDDVVTPENSGNSTTESVCSDHVLAYCSSSTGFKESLKSVDLEEENEVSTEFFATSVGDSVDFTTYRRETPPPLSDVQVESGELESSAMPLRDLNSRRRSMAAKMPSEGELEEFFTAAETNLQKKFIDKYNFNVVKDEPLEGRYEWVQIQLKP